MSSRKQILKQMRNDFRDSVFSRDNGKCVLCGKRGSLDAHHITSRKKMPADGYVANNGISLCSKCHIKAEDFLNGFCSNNNFSPEVLYEKIKSSYDEAYQDALNLYNEYFGEK